MRGHRIIMDPIMTIFGLKLKLDENKNLEGRCDRKMSHFGFRLFFKPSGFVYDIEILQKRNLGGTKRARLLYKGISMKHHQE
jgi:hypothetical protein